LRKTDSDFHDLIKHLSPLGWEHINLTGDYIWSTKLKTSMLRIPFLSVISIKIQNYYAWKEFGRIILNYLYSSLHWRH
jgi:hypothetical protein